MATQIRNMGLFSDLKRQFKDELSKNEDLKQNLEEAKRASEKLQTVESKAKEALQDASRKTQDASQYMSSQVSEASQKIRAMYDESTVHEATKNAKEKYENIKEESQPSEEMFSNVKNMTSSIRSSMREIRRKAISDDAVPRFKESIRKASHELFGSSKKKDIESTLSFRTTDSKTKESPKGTEKAEEYTGPSALVTVKEQKNAWDKIGARLKEAPIIRGILDAARQAAETRAGQKLGKGAKMAKDKIGDATEDAREFWETSQNPWIYRLSSLYDGFFGETEMAIAIREIRRSDPSFILEQWKDDVEEIVIPEVLGGFLRGEGLKLRKWFGEAAYNTMNFAIRERKSEGLVANPDVLAIRNVEVIAAKAEDKQAPLLVLQFMAQQINCIKNREGEIVEGAEDEVRAVFYALAFQRDYDEEAGVLQWKIVEMAMIGDVPYV